VKINSIAAKTPYLSPKFATYIKEDFLLDHGIDPDEFL